MAASVARREEGAPLWGPNYQIRRAELYRNVWCLSDPVDPFVEPEWDGMESCQVPRIAPHNPREKQPKDERESVIWVFMKIALVLLVLQHAYLPVVFYTSAQDQIRWGLGVLCSVPKHLGDQAFGALGFCADWVWAWFGFGASCSQPVMAQKDLGVQKLP